MQECRHRGVLHDMSVASKSEIKTGEAQIISTISGNEKKYYNIPKFYDTFVKPYDPAGVTTNELLVMKASL